MELNTVVMTKYQMHYNVRFILKYLCKNINTCAIFLNRTWEICVTTYHNAIETKGLHTVTFDFTIVMSDIRIESMIHGVGNV